MRRSIGTEQLFWSYESLPSIQFLSFLNLLKIEVNIKKLKKIKIEVKYTVKILKM